MCFVFYLFKGLVNFCDPDGDSIVSLLGVFSLPNTQVKVIITSEVLEFKSDSNQCLIFMFNTLTEKFEYNSIMKYYFDIGVSFYHSVQLLIHYLRCFYCDNLNIQMISLLLYKVSVRFCKIRFCQ